METIRTALALLEEGDLFSAMDLKDTDLHVPISSSKIFTRRGLDKKERNAISSSLAYHSGSLQLLIPPPTWWLL